MPRRIIKLASILCFTLPLFTIAASGGEPATGQVTDPTFSMGIMDAFKITGKGVVLTGRIDSGVIHSGDSICLTAARIGTRTLTVDAIQIGQQMPESAKQGDIVGILVNGIDKGDIARGGSDKLTASCAP